MKYTCACSRNQNQAGFSLIELVIYLAILGILMAAVLTSFTQTMRNSTNQANVAETKIETGIGLELLRTDLENAGFGLPWQFPAVPAPYFEPAPMADVPNVPKALISQDTSLLSLNTSDYLVIRATNVIRGITGQEWGYVGRDAARAVTVDPMSTDGFARNDWVIVIRPESSPGVYRQLVMNGATYVTQITPSATGITLTDQSFAPIATPNDPDGERFLVYGLNNNDPTVATNVRRPFNRTDYYINNVNNANRPTHCAPNTGVLVKATLNQADDQFTIMPIVDCVADFQIVYYLDTNDDGGWDQRGNANALNTLAADQIRDRVKAVRYYILTHEGGPDRSFSYSNANINVGEVAADGVTLLAGRLFDLNATIGGNWANYRWKVESMAVSSKNIK